MIMTKKQEVVELNKPHLSISQMMMFLKCQRQYYYRYIRGLKLPPSGALLLGTSVHAGIETNYKQKIETGKDISLKKAVEAYAHRFEEGEKEGVAWNEDEKPGEVKDMGVEMVSVYHKEIAPKVKPKLVEEWFEVDFENTPYQFVGRIDLVDKQNRVVDHKTVAPHRIPKQEDVDKDLQMTGYSLGYRNKYKKAEKEIRMDYIVKPKKLSPVRIEQITTKRKEKDIDRLLKLMAYVAIGIQRAKETDVWLPCQGCLGAKDYWWCANPKFNGYYEINKRELFA